MEAGMNKFIKDDNFMKYVKSRIRVKSFYMYGNKLKFRGVNGESLEFRIINNQLKEI